MKLAILDIDGTLYGGTLGIDLLKELARANLFNPRALEKIMEATRAHEEGRLSRDELAARIYELYGEGIAGLDRSRVEQVAAQTWERNKHRVFPFVEELLALLKEQGYTTVAMTGSPVEIAGALSGLYGLDHLYAADFESVNGRYTGSLNFSPGLHGMKRDLLQALARQTGMDLGASIALGDSENDFEMFDLVGVPIAMDPKGELLARAQVQGWRLATPETIIPALASWLSQLPPPDVASPPPPQAAAELPAHGG